MIKIVLLTIVFAIIIIYLKGINSELFTLATVGASIIIISLVLEYIGQAFSVFNMMIEATKIDRSLFNIIFKIMAIGYLVEFGAGIVNDFGLKSLADKLVFAGKIVIFCMSLPIIYAVFNLFTELLG